MLRTRIQMAAVMVAAALASCAPIQVSTNRLPIARAGEDQVVLLGTSVVLDGSPSTDGDADPLTYSWSLAVRPAGSTAELVPGSEPHLVTLTPDIAGAYGVRLIVSDGKVDSGANTVVVTVPGANAAPIAVAGPDQTVGINTLVTLDGSSSKDPDGAALTYQWTLSTRPSTSAATLSGSTTAKPTFTPDATGVYAVKLTVSDGQSTSSPTVTIVNVAGTNAAPSANAGADKFAVTSQTLVQLDGSASDADPGTTLYYMWQFENRPVGSTATLSDPTAANPTFIPDRTGTYDLILAVDDGQNVTRDRVQVSADVECCFEVVGGTPQTATVGTALPVPFSVRVKNQYGLGVAGVPISWNITSGSGSLSATTFVTNNEGVAQTTLTLGTTAGATQVTATCGSGLCTPASVVFDATGTHDVPYAVQVGTPASNVTVPGPTSFSFVVLDRYGNIATTDSATQFTVTASGSAVISAATTGSIITGAATNTALVQVSAGVIALQATDEVAETVDFNAVDSQANGLLYPSGSYSSSTPFQGNLCDFGTPTQSFTLNGPFPSPNGDATVTVRGLGDLGSTTEYFSLTVESVFYGNALAGSGECSTVHMSSSYTIPLSTLQSYIADGVFSTQLSASGSVNCSVCTTHEAQIVLTYPASGGTTATFSM